MKVLRDDAVAICAGVGFKNSKRWDKARMDKKLTEFATDEAYDSLEIEADAIDDEEELERLNDLLAKMRDAGESIEVVEEFEEGDLEGPDESPEEDDEREGAESEEEEDDEEQEEDSNDDEDEEEEKDSDDDEDEEELTLIDLGKAADDGDKAAAKEVAKRAKACGLDPDDYKSYTSCAKAIEGKPVKKGKGKGKGKGKKEPKGPSSFGTATDLMCKNPDMEYADLKKQMIELGLFKQAAVSTAYSSVKKVVKLLRANKKMK